MSSGEGSEKKTLPRRQGVGRGAPPGLGRRGEPGKTEKPAAAPEVSPATHFAPPAVATALHPVEEQPTPTGEASETGDKKTGRLSGRRLPAQEQIPPPPPEPQRLSPPESGSPGHEEKMAKKMALLQLTKRKGYCTLGKPYRMMANHFEVRFQNPNQGFMIHLYHVSIVHERIQKLTPDENRQVFWKCISGNQATFKKPFGCAYDGAKQMFSIDELKFPNLNTSFEFAVDAVIVRDDRTLRFNCTLQYLGPMQVDLTTVGVSVEAEQTIAPIQVLDIIFRQMRSHPELDQAKRFFAFRSNVYDIPEVAGVDLGYGKEIWPGMYHSVHVYENNKVFLNLEVKHGAFFSQRRRERGGNDHYDAIQFMIDVLNSEFLKAKGGQYRGPLMYHRDQLNDSTCLNSRDVSIILREFTGVFVRTTHRQGTNTKKKVCGFCKSPSEETFSDRDGRTQTVFDYFKEKYPGVVKYPKLPTLNIGSRVKPCAMPMDVCIIEKKQRVSKKLTENQTSVMIKQAASGGALNRYEQTRRIFDVGNFTSDPFCKEFGLMTNNQMVMIDGRVLPPPPMMMRERENLRPGQIRTVVNMTREHQANFDYQNAYKFEQAAFTNASIIKAVACLTFAHDRERVSCQNFMADQLRTLTELGCIVPMSPHVTVNADFTPEGAKWGLEDCVRQMNAQGKPLIEKGAVVGIVFVIVPMRNSMIYAKIKQVAEIELGIMTQVVQMKTFEKRATINIGLKVNLKMRGHNAALNPRDIGQKYYYQEPTLLVGIDVSHPSPIDKRSPSIAAIVSNTDSSKDLFQWAATVKIQKKRREAIIYLNDAIKERLICYFTNTKAKPARIIVYRDGVSEGQFAEVLREEIRGIREACSSLSSDYRPKITFIIVTKRHNTRLYPGSDKGCGKSCNVHPGSLVDKVIVSQDLFDFYLCSHYGIQGTSRPAKYTVLYDDSNFPADEIQLITYYTTFLYQRASRSVSIPAPVYFADLACTRARSHLSSLTGDTSDTTPSSPSGSAEDAQGSIPEDDLIRLTTVTNTLRERMYFT